MSAATREVTLHEVRKKRQLEAAVESWQILVEQLGRGHRKLAPSLIVIYRHQREKVDCAVFAGVLPDSQTVVQCSLA